MFVFLYLSYLCSLLSVQFNSRLRLQKYFFLGHVLVFSSKFCLRKLSMSCPKLNSLKNWRNSFMLEFWIYIWGEGVCNLQKYSSHYNAWLLDKTNLDLNKHVCSCQGEGGIVFFVMFFFCFFCFWTDFIYFSVNSLFLTGNCVIHSWRKWMKIQGHAEKNIFSLFFSCVE